MRLSLSLMRTRGGGRLRRHTIRSRILQRPHYCVCGQYSANDHSVRIEGTRLGRNILCDAISTLARQAHPAMLRRTLHTLTPTLEARPLHLLLTLRTRLTPPHPAALAPPLLHTLLAPQHPLRASARRIKPAKPRRRRNKRLAPRWDRPAPAAPTAAVSEPDVGKLRGHRAVAGMAVAVADDGVKCDAPGARLQDWYPGGDES